MKKILFALCALLLVPTLALANSDMVSVSELCQQVEAMGRWTASYEAYKREIEVDIPIDIPEVDAVPIVQVSGYYAVDQEGRLTRDGTKLNRIGYDGFDIYEEDGLLMYLSTTCANGEIKAASFEQDKSVLLLAYYNSPSNLRTHKVKGIDDYNLGDYVDDYPSGTYNLSIREMMDGIPIYVDVGDRLSLDLASDKGKKGVNDFWRKNVKLWRVRDNYFEFMNKSRFELDTAWLKRVNKIEEDVPLKNVDVIIKNLEKEIEKGKIRKIYALKLGYCVYFSDEGKNIYTIYPVWMCECDYTESAKEELKKSEQIPDERKQYYYKQLVINAQTGQIEPYLIEKQELAYCPRVITWEDTQ